MHGWAEFVCQWLSFSLTGLKNKAHVKIEIIILLKEKNVNKAYPCNRALALQKKSVLFKHENLLFLCYMQINIKKEALVEKKKATNHAILFCYNNLKFLLLIINRRKKFHDFN